MSLSLDGQGTVKPKTRIVSQALGDSCLGVVRGARIALQQSPILRRAIIYVPLEGANGSREKKGDIRINREVAFE